MDARERSVLAAVRSLDQAGYLVTATASTWLAPGLWSRACSSRRLLPDPAVHLDDFLTNLVALIRADRHEVLLPGTDATLYAISRYRDRLEPYVRLGLPDHEVVMHALDREWVGRQAVAAGLGPPEGVVCRRVEEALDAARQFGFPVVVKPVNTVVELDGRLARHASRLVSDERTLRDAQGQLGSCIVQRQEVGHVVSFAGVAVNGEVLASVVARYRRTWPPEAGNACFSETIAAPSSLVERVETLIDGIGWSGVFELELIERFDGTIEVIDFNPRVYGSLSLALAAGVPLPAIWCKCLLGERPLVARARVGARYRWEDGDLRHALWRLHHGGAREALAVLSPQVDVTNAYFRSLDPAPMIARGMQVAKVAHRRRSRTLAAQLEDLGNRQHDDADVES
jgi:predicted ATP-grasp superfamily ATP-dependent carboligase